MQQMLPLLLDWLSAAPDPDLGLLGLRNLATGPQRSMELAVRVSRITGGRGSVSVDCSARAGCSGELLRRNPDMIDSLGDPDALRLRSHATSSWRGRVSRWSGERTPTSVGPH